MGIIERIFTLMVVIVIVLAPIVFVELICNEYSLKNGIIICILMGVTLLVIFADVIKECFSKGVSNE